MQFGGRVKVLSPESLKNDVAKRVKELNGIYNEE